MDRALDADDARLPEGAWREDPGYTVLSGVLPRKGLEERARSIVTIR